MSFSHIFDPTRSIFTLYIFVFFFSISHTSNSIFAQNLEIINIRVGQGDATLIKGPGEVDSTRIYVLVDGGDISNLDGGNILRAVLYKHGVNRLNYVIVTHYDADHIGGIVSGEHHGISFLLGWNKQPGSSGDDDGDGFANWIDSTYWTPDPEELGTGDDIKVDYFVDRGDESHSDTDAYKKYKLIAEAHNNRKSIVSKTILDTFEIDLGNDAKMIALAANGYVRNRNNQVAYVNTENERSLSFLVTYKDFDFLISGDLIGRRHGSENAKVEAAVGKYIKDEDIIVDVLHVNHHGANNSSDSIFLDYIKPIIAIISAGNGNTHDHPDKDALKRLEEAGVYRIIQTSWGTTRDVMPKNIREIQAIYQNDVIVSSNGENFTISTSRTYDVDVNPNQD